MRHQANEIASLSSSLEEARASLDRSISESTERIGMLTSQRNIFLSTIRSSEEMLGSLKNDAQQRERTLMNTIKELQSALEQKEKDPLFNQYQCENEELKKKIQHQENDLNTLVSSMNGLVYIVMPH